ncbi:MAG: hypothetical protein QJR02_01480 [Sinobacteraceae bacterium]|nr:hypothetical protein [Nevskiaceae bacterium]
MSKLADTLHAMGIHNDHGLLMRFGGERDVVVDYSAGEPRASIVRGSSVWSPHFKTESNSAWYQRGNKAFIGKRADSFPQALKWAEEQYGITDWLPSPFGGSKVPARVVKAAKIAAMDFIKSRAAP